VVSLSAVPSVLGGLFSSSPPPESRLSPGGGLLVWWAWKPPGKPPCKS
jgi:hypothetical protein